MATERTRDGGLNLEVVESRPRTYMRLDPDDLYELWTLLGGEALEIKIERIIERLSAVESRQGVGGDKRLTRPRSNR